MRRGRSWGQRGNYPPEFLKFHCGSVDSLRGESENRGEWVTGRKRLKALSSPAKIEKKVHPSCPASTAMRRQTVANWCGRGNSRKGECIAFEKRALFGGLGEVMNAPEAKC